MDESTWIENGKKLGLESSDLMKYVSERRDKYYEDKAASSSWKEIREPMKENYGN